MQALLPKVPLAFCFSCSALLERCGVELGKEILPPQAGGRVELLVKDKTKIIFESGPAERGGVGDSTKQFEFFT